MARKKTLSAPKASSESNVASPPPSSERDGTASPPDRPRVVGFLDDCAPDGFTGWCAEPQAPERSLFVEITSDGVTVGRVPANLHRKDVEAAGIGIGNHGFSFRPPAVLFDGKPHRIEAKEVGSGTELAGSPKIFAATYAELIVLRKELYSDFVEELLNACEQTKPAELTLRVRQSLCEAAASFAEKPFSRNAKRLRQQLDAITQAFCDYRILGFGARDQLQGWVRDKARVGTSLTIELIENEKVIASAVNNGIDLRYGYGKFALNLPASVQDGRLHRFTLRIAEHGGEMCSLDVVTPSSTQHWSDDDLEFLQDAVWRGVPSTKFASGIAPPERSEPDKKVARIQEALNELEEDDAENRYPLLCDLAAILESSGKTEQALVAYEAAEKAANGALDGLRGYVNALLCLGREEEAVSRLAIAMKANPDDTGLLELMDKVNASKRPKTARIVAFYLPQFHPIAENDEWWGRGFTEWTNVGSATSLFDGHLQPRRPTALGYYDLRLAEAANAQFELARRYGIDGFCYYYYWFHGRRLLEKPLADLVDGKTGPFPFCICWANEDWTRSWDGSSGEVLLAQDHSVESDLAFIKDVAPLLRHKDYIRWDGKPVLIVYRVDKLANPARTAKAWRDWCRKQGIGELHLCAAQSFGYGDPGPDGFDAAVEFPPHCAWVQHPELQFHRELKNLPNVVPGFAGKIFDYQTFASASIARPREPYTLHRTAMVAWDNTARRQKTAHVFHQFSVETFESWVGSNFRRSALEQQDSLTFVNAWNEWAEGTVMEPDDRFGYEILEATKRSRISGTYAAHDTYWREYSPVFPETRHEMRERILVFGHDAFPAGAQRNLLNMARCLKRQLNMDVVIFLVEGGELLSEYERVGPTRVLGTGPNWRGDLEAELRKYRALGTRKVICNTIATGEIAEVAHAEKYRVISLVHELPTLIDSKGLAHHCWRIAGNADNIVFASRVVADEFCNRYWPDGRKILIAPQGIVPNPYHAKREEMRALVRKELNLDAKTLMVIGCGYGDTRKGIDLFVQMATDVRRRMEGRPIAFVWVGEIEAGMLPYVMADVDRLELEDIFHVTGVTNDPGRYFIAADVFALTSREDPFPSVVMEAFDAYLPVVAFDGGGGYVDIVNDETGRLVPYLDVAAMGVAIAELLQKDRIRQKIGSSAHAMCVQQFAYPAYMRKLLALLGGMPPERLIQEGKGSRPKERLTISVIVPNFNYGRYLELRLRTILDQTVRPDEIIVLDDASTDHSIEIIEEICQNSPIPIQFVRNKSNSGSPFAQWSKGLSLAKSDLVWIAEADDYCEPTLLETLVAEFRKPNVVLCWADSIMVDEKGQSSGFAYKHYYDRNYGSKWHMHFCMSGSALMDDCLIAENVIPNASAVLFRRSSVPSDLEVIKKYKFSGDWWFWLCVASTGDVVYRADELNYHRRHSQSVMGEVLRAGSKLLPESMSFYQRLLKLRPQFLSNTSKIQLVKRLETLYQLFPELTAEYPRLGLHPSFSAQYGALIHGMKLGAALRQSGTRIPATLVISSDVFASALNAEAFLGQLALKYELQILLIAAKDACLNALERLGKEISPLVFDPHEIGGRAKAAQAARARWKDAIEASADKLFTYGLEAHVFTAAALGGRRIDWTIVAGREFDTLLGRLPDSRVVTIDELRSAISKADRALVIGGDRSIPHAFARMSQEHRLPVDHFPMPHETNARATLSYTTEPRVMAIAGNVDQDTIYRIAKITESADASLLLLAWGEAFETLKSQYSSSPGVDVACLYEKPRSFAHLADIVVLFHDGSTAIDSLCFELRRDGVQVCEVHEEEVDARKMKALLDKAIRSVRDVKVARSGDTARAVEVTE